METSIWQIIILKQEGTLGPPPLNMSLQHSPLRRPTDQQTRGTQCLPRRLDANCHDAKAFGGVGQHTSDWPCSLLPHGGAPSGDRISRRYPPSQEAHRGGWHRTTHSTEAGGPQRNGDAILQGRRPPGEESGDAPPERTVQTSWAKPGGGRKPPRCGVDTTRTFMWELLHWVRGCSSAVRMSMCYLW
jgi:hypothetical protein